MKRTSEERAGMTLVEVTIAFGVLAIVMIALTVDLQNEASTLSAIARKTHLHTSADILMERVTSELKFARGVSPQAWLGSEVLSADPGPLRVDTTRGFPNRGYLLLEPGTDFEERIGYDGLSMAPPSFLNLERGFNCSDATGHFPGVLAVWGGMAVAIDNQLDPPESFYDGISQESHSQVYFRGDGTGFAAQVPVDLEGDGTFFDANGDVQWGAVIDGMPTTDGFTCMYFEAVALITEAGRGGDLNGDGDRADSFDVGRIRKRSWDAKVPGSRFTDVAVGPSMILQESCNWGSDLDNDAFQDPMFLWEPEGGRLRVRLFVLAEARKNVPLVRRIESNLFLRNGIDN